MHSGGGRGPAGNEEDNPPIEPSSPFNPPSAEAQPSQSTQQQQPGSSRPSLPREIFDPVSSSSTPAPQAPTSSSQSANIARGDPDFFDIGDLAPLPSSRQTQQEVVDPGEELTSSSGGAPSLPSPNVALHSRQPHSQGLNLIDGAGGTVSTSSGGILLPTGGDIVPSEPSNIHPGSEEFVSSTTAAAKLIRQPADLPALSSSTAAYSQPSELSVSIADTDSLPSYEVGQGHPSSSTTGPSQSQHPSQSSAHPNDPIKFHVDPTLLERVLDFGFEHYIATLAIQRTGGRGVEQAVNWIIDHSNPSDFEEEEGLEGGEDTSGTSQANNAERMGLGSSSLAGAALPRTHKMIFVANMELKMGVGKLAAQVGHATLGVYRIAQKSEEGQLALNAWRNHGEVKIVVKGQSTEQLLDLFKQAKDNGIYAYLVQDAGYTQVTPGSRTVLGIFGPQESVDQITGSLKLL